MLITNAHILPIGREELKNAYILVENGIIISIGDMSSAPRWQDEYDAEGAYAVPGFIDCHTHIGLFEPAGQEANEYGKTFTPQYRVTDSIDFSSKDFDVAVKSGITTVAISPGSGAVCSGQIALVATGTKEVINECVAIKMAFGENTKHKSGITTRMEAVSILREGLMKAKRYRFKDVDLASEVLQNVLDKKIPIHAHVHTSSDIAVAINLAKEFDIDIKLIHATEGYKILDLIKDNNIDVITGPTMTRSNRYETENKRADTPAVLASNGIRVAISSDHPITPIEHLPLAAALTSKNGLPPLETLEALTTMPAKILGVDDVLGSIDLDKQGDIAIFDKFPLELYAEPKAVFQKGVQVC
ncbi:amidohydrolase family protein [Treponema sp. R6D11]